MRALHRLPHGASLWMRPIEPTDELWARIEALITALNKRGEH